MTTLCPDPDLNALVAALQTGDGDDIRNADRLLERFPADPRLHFLRGSLLASIGRPIEALSSLRRAVELAPDFHLARFQLGFFQLTSGEPLAALESWGPIVLLSEDNYLRFFVGGLTHLIRDEFDECIRRLREGIDRNQENLPLNRDMLLLIERVEESRREAGAGAEGGSEASATSFLLNQLSGQGRLN